MRLPLELVHFVKKAVKQYFLEFLHKIVNFIPELVSAHPVISWDDWLIECCSVFLVNFYCEVELNLITIFKLGVALLYSACSNNTSCCSFDLACQKKCLLYSSNMLTDITLASDAEQHFLFEKQSWNNLLYTPLPMWSHKYSCVSW